MVDCHIVSWYSSTISIFQNINMYCASLCLCVPARTHVRVCIVCMYIPAAYGRQYIHRVLIIHFTVCTSMHCITCLWFSNNISTQTHTHVHTLQTHTHSDRKRCTHPCMHTQTQAHTTCMPNIMTYYVLHNPYILHINYSILPIKNLNNCTCIHNDY